MLKSTLDQLARGRGYLNKGKPNGYKYTSFYQYVADLGTPYVSKELTEEEWRVAEDHLLDGEPRQCFANCQQLVTSLMHLPIQYVEGYVVCDVSFPLHHGWLLYNGKVVDPTLKVRKPFDRERVPHKVAGIIPKGWEYIGVVYTVPRIIEYTLRTKCWGSLIDDWTGGWPLLKGER